MKENLHEESCEKKDMIDKKLKKKKEKKKKDKKKKKKSEKLQQSWGKYGIINSGDMYMKREEFMMWLSEVKKVNIEQISQQEEKKYFEEYVESYNTATMPSKKYYNFKIWFSKEQFKDKNKNEPDKTIIDDYAQKKKEVQDAKVALRNQKINQEYQNLHECSAMVQDMQNQKQLTELMKHQYMMGNHEAAIKIQKQLNSKGPNFQAPPNVGGNGDDDY